MTLLNYARIVLNMSVTAGWVILILLVLRPVLKKLPGSFSCALWMVALLRLTCPVSFTAGFSLLGFFDRGVQASEPVAVVEQTVAVPASAMQWAPPEAAQTPDLMWILACLWAAGVAVMLLYLLISFVRLRRYTRTALLVTPGIYRCDRVGSAFVLGVMRPSIYLPAQLQGADQDLIIAHEKAHIHRLDHIVKLVAFTVVCIHWFNPLAWLCMLLLGRDMERACDERVLRQMGEDRRGDYGRLLLDMASEHRDPSLGVVCFGTTSVKQRILNVLRYRRPAVGLVAAASVLILVAAVCLLANPAPKPVPLPGPVPSITVEPPAPPPESSSEAPPAVSSSTPPPVSSSAPNTLPIMEADLDDNPALTADPGLTTPEELADLTVTTTVVGTDAEGVPFSMMWPVAGGYVVVGFEDYKGHTGMDIAAPFGTEIYAAQSGTVTYASKESIWPYGKRVDIDHGNGVVTRYAHCSEVLVEQDDVVVQGQLIAQVGKTGNAASVHCHFEIRQNGEVLDPALHVGEKFPGSKEIE